MLGATCCWQIQGFNGWGSSVWETFGQTFVVAFISSLSSRKRNQVGHDIYSWFWSCSGLISGPRLIFVHPASQAWRRLAPAAVHIHKAAAKELLIYAKTRKILPHSKVRQFSERYVQTLGSTSAYFIGTDVKRFSVSAKASLCKVLWNLSSVVIAIIKIVAKKSPTRSLLTAAYMLDGTI